MRVSVAKHFEQRTLTGPMYEIRLATDWVIKHGFRIIVAGPMPVSKRKYDVARFRYVVEREINPPEIGS